MSEEEKSKKKGPAPPDRDASNGRKFLQHAAFSSNMARFFILHQDERISTDFSAGLALHEQAAAHHKLAVQLAELALGSFEQEGDSTGELEQLSKQASGILEINTKKLVSVDSHISRMKPLAKYLLRGPLGRCSLKDLKAARRSENNVLNPMNRLHFSQFETRAGACVINANRLYNRVRDVIISGEPISACLEVEEALDKQYATGIVLLHELNYASVVFKRNLEQDIEDSKVGGYEQALKLLPKGCPQQTVTMMYLFFLSTRSDEYLTTLQNLYNQQYKILLDGVSRAVDRLGKDTTEIRSRIASLKALELCSSSRSKPSSAEKLQPHSRKTSSPPYKLKSYAHVTEMFVPTAVAERDSEEEEEGESDLDEDYEDEDEDEDESDEEGKEPAPPVLASASTPSKRSSARRQPLGVLEDASRARGDKSQELLLPQFEEEADFLVEDTPNTRYVKRDLLQIFGDADESEEEKDLHEIDEEEEEEEEEEDDDEDEDDQEEGDDREKGGKDDSKPKPSFTVFEDK